MVDVKINGTSTARLVLDTGADGTLISPRALRAAGVSLVTPIGTGQVIGVTGSDRVPFVMVESLEVGDARVVKLPVGAYEIAQAEGDGLLGRDFLNRFNVTIDAVRGLVTLSPK
jgi:predicted aspartyl protease